MWQNLNIAAKKKYKPRKTHAICMLSAVPVRRKPASASEMVTQLLFGELCEIITKKHSNWCRIICQYDGYEGWVDAKQLYLLTQNEYIKYQSHKAYALDITQSVIGDNIHIPVLIGASFPYYDGISFKMPGGTYRYSGQVYFPEQTPFKVELLKKVALKYLHAPYLYGGRTPFGIDGSGFVQVIFKIFGIHLPRDAYHQANEGELLDFVAQAELGDLAFFDDDEGKIVHVGLVADEGTIIHAFGQVRQDLLDHYGIFNKDSRSYTHKLRYIRRIIHS